MHKWNFFLWKANCSSGKVLCKSPSPRQKIEITFNYIFCLKHNAVHYKDSQHKMWAEIIMKKILWKCHMEFYPCICWWTMWRSCKALWLKGLKLLLCAMHHFHILQFIYLSYYSYIAAGFPLALARLSESCGFLFDSQWLVRGWVECGFVFITSLPPPQQIHVASSQLHASPINIASGTN